jgi:3-deoxy-D-manno-octulosonic acid (KDO) 8-phosphate synthase
VAPVAVKTGAVRKSDGTPDYARLDVPTVIRERERERVSVDQYDEEILDIPAFLRRQAD